MIRVVLVLEGNDVVHAVQEVMFALRENWGERDSANLIQKVEATKHD